jgi:hypothetical protein
MSSSPNASARPNCCSARTSVFVQAALHDQAQVVMLPRQQFVEAVLDDVAARSGDALLVLQLLVRKVTGGCARRA